VTRDVETTVDVVDALIERSSLGEAGVKKLRARTSPERAQQIVLLSVSLRGVSGRGDIGVFVTTTSGSGDRCRSHAERRNEMIGLRVTCIEKPNRYSSHEHITSVGVDGYPSRYTVAQVIQCIRSGGYEFYTQVGGRKAVVNVVDVPGRTSYIRTSPDSTGKDNLLALPECVG
jgi:hypothetical protein